MILTYFILKCVNKVKVDVLVIYKIKKIKHYNDDSTIINTKKKANYNF